MDEPQPTARKRERHWLRALRPLVWWAVLVLLLFAYHTHQRWLEQTRINFTIDLEGKPVEGQASVTWDGRQVTGGERVSLGHHQFVVSHAKGERIETNPFIWYGPHDFGAISLKRVRGVLALEVVPPAARLSVVGSEFSVTLTNSAGVSSSVPTDVYRVEAHWANHEETKQVTVTTTPMGLIRLAPPLGSVSLESDPSGASVIGSDGRTLGITPLILPELPPGLCKGELRLDGYIPVPFSLSIVANQTNSFRTNLVNWQYSQAMESAKASFAAGDIERTLQMLSAVLKAKPNDPEAMALEEKAAALQKQATVATHLRRATELVERGDYAAARQAAQEALDLKPDNAEAKALLATIEKREQALLQAKEQKRAQDLAEQQRQDRLNRQKLVLDSLCASCLDADLFPSHEITCTKPVKEVGDAIQNVMQSESPPFEVTRYDWPQPETFAIEIKKQALGRLRQCLIVGGQTREGETRIVFKVLEYDTHLNANIGGILRVTDGHPPLVAVRPSRIPNMTSQHEARLKEGVQIVTDRIRRAVGQKSPY